MVNLAQKIMYLFPDAISNADFQVFDNGSGPVISHWNAAKLGPQPTQPQIDVAAISAAKVLAKASVKSMRNTVMQTYSSRSVIYQANFDASTAILAGQGDVVKMGDTSTALAYGTAMAASMGQADAIAWANYIIQQWTQLGAGVRAVEEQYLILTYNPTLGIDSMADEALIDAAVAAFKVLAGV